MCLTKCLQRSNEIHLFSLSCLKFFQKNSLFLLELFSLFHDILTLSVNSHNSIVVFFLDSTVAPVLVIQICFLGHNPLILPILESVLFLIHPLLLVFQNKVIIVILFFLSVITLGLVLIEPSTSLSINTVSSLESDLIKQLPVLLLFLLQRISMLHETRSSTDLLIVHFLHHLLLSVQIHHVLHGPFLFFLQLDYTGEKLGTLEFLCLTVDDSLHHFVLDQRSPLIRLHHRWEEL